MDYLVTTAIGSEAPAETFNEAQHYAAMFRQIGQDPIIDQYDENEELTGVYWTYDSAGKLVRHA